jgi:hypothetical protein
LESSPSTQIRALAKHAEENAIIRKIKNLCVLLIDASSYLST